MQLSEFLENKAAIRTIIRFLTAPKEIALVLYGAPGTGKTALLECIFKELDLCPLVLNTESFQSLKQFREYVENYLFSYTITQMLGGSHYASKILFLDDLDILVQQDKTLLSYLSTLLERCKTVKSRTPKLVFASGRTDEKKFAATLHKHIPPTQIVRLTEPSEMTLLPYLQQVCRIQGFSDDPALLMPFMKIHGCNVRYCLMNLEFLSSGSSSLAVDPGPASSCNNGATSLSLEESGMCMSLACRPDMTYTEAMHALFEDTASQGMPSLAALEMRISCEPFLLCYMIYENVFVFLEQKVGSGRQARTEDAIHEALLRILTVYAQGSVLEAASCAFHSLSMHISYMMRIGVTLLTLDRLCRTLPLRLLSSVPSNVSNVLSSFNYGFTTVMNKTGLQASSRKRAVRIGHEACDMNREQLVYLFDCSKSSSMVRKYVQQNLSESALGYYMQSFNSQKKSRVSNKGLS